jgi:hypothetical protein
VGSRPQLLRAGDHGVGSRPQLLRAGDHGVISRPQLLRAGDHGVGSRSQLAANACSTRRVLPSRADTRRMMADIPRGLVSKQAEPSPCTRGGVTTCSARHRGGSWLRERGASALGDMRGRTPRLCRVAVDAGPCVDRAGAWESVARRPGATSARGCLGSAEPAGDHERRQREARAPSEEERERRELTRRRPHQRPPRAPGPRPRPAATSCAAAARARLRGAQRQSRPRCRPRRGAQCRC